MSNHSRLPDSPPDVGGSASAPPDPTAGASDDASEANGGVARRRDPSLALLPERVPYEDFAAALQATCLVNDPWYDGEPTYRSAPLVVDEDRLAELFSAGERIGALYEELAQIVRAAPALLDGFFALPPHYKLMWLSSGGFWHGFARMDMFRRPDGRLSVCELNADTPSGQMETLVPQSLVAPRFPHLRDPNASYEARLWDLLVTLHRTRTGDDDAVPKSIGIVYPTDLPEDITLIRLYQRWFEARGCHTELGSPFNVDRVKGGGVALFGRRMDVILRHYKTDWWGERPPLWKDDEPAIDPDPLREELFRLLDAEQKGEVVVVNPFGALLAQNKRSMAFFHEEKARFSEPSQRTIDELVPETRRLESVDLDVIAAERERWVLKSDFGCEGEEVLLGPQLTDAEWREALDMALPHAWVVQRHFDIAPLDDGTLPNFGIYLIAGQAAGLLVRSQPPSGLDDTDARVLPVLAGDPADAVARETQHPTAHPFAVVDETLLPGTPPTAPRPRPAPAARDDDETAPAARDDDETA